MEQFARSAIVMIGGAISWLVGGWSLLLTVLLILNAIDFITGMAANWGQISSGRGYQGIIKKGMMWVWIIVANLIYLVLLDMGYSIGQIIPDAVALMFILNEIISLSENSAKLGVDMPTPVKKALDIFNVKKAETLSIPEKIAEAGVLAPENPVEKLKVMEPTIHEKEILAAEVSEVLTGNPMDKKLKAGDK